MAQNSSNTFDEQRLLETLKHYLPTQGPLKDFVHHNTLHAFQDMKFYDAIHKASTIFGYQTTFTLDEYRDLYKIKRITRPFLDKAIHDRKGEAGLSEWRKKCLRQTYDDTSDARIGHIHGQWRRNYPVNLTNAVQPLLFRILCSYIDQGIAISPFPFEDKGLLAAVRNLEKYSAVSFFKTQKARKLLQSPHCTTAHLLELLIGKGYEAYYEQYVYDQQFAHRGWSGIVSTLESRPETLLYPKKIELRDMITLELLLELDALTHALGDEWRPLGVHLQQPPVDMFAEQPTNELQEVIKIWHDAFEWSYYDSVLAGIALTSEAVAPTASEPTRFQAVFCIDEREYSIRTHVESLDARVQTYGAPGYFGIDMYFQPMYAKFYDKVCPAPMSPKYLIREIATGGAHGTHKAEAVYNKQSHKLVRGLFYSYLLGVPAIGKLILNLIHPAMSPAIADASAHMNPDAELTIAYTGEHEAESGLQIGYTYPEMADRVEKVLRCMGLANNFAPLVYIVGHGSSSANNPHHGAHDCGACSGRPGLANARVFAHMANDKQVRRILKGRGLVIPVSSQFIGALHDTASDEIAYYDTDRLSSAHREVHIENMRLFEDALDLNAKERSRRFMSIDTKRPIKQIRKEIKKRSVSFFEPRPELGHGTNALCIVGRRSLTQHVFLDRRAFLNSYDYTTDLDGALLCDVLAPLGPVCGGVNLEYYFSRMDNYKLGAGTKLPHNVMGLVGVANSSDGDLRSGLPLQMIEVHDPVRLMMIVEHFPDVIQRTIVANPSLHEWFANEWIHLVAMHPTEKRLYTYRDEKFVPYQPLTHSLPVTHDIPRLFETTAKMKSNHILDATQENIPVHIIE
jgi:uncharacterized protein